MLPARMRARPLLIEAKPSTSTPLPNWALARTADGNDQAGSDPARQQLIGCQRPHAGSPKLIKQRLGLFQIGRVKAFGEPAVDWREKVAGFDAAALVAA